MRNYETRCKQDSIKIAEAFKKLSATNWTEKDYQKYQKVIKKTHIPKDMLNNIQDEISKTKGNYRPIDIYQFWN